MGYLSDLAVVQPLPVLFAGFYVSQRLTHTGIRECYSKGSWMSTEQTRLTLTWTSLTKDDMRCASTWRKNTALIVSVQSPTLFGTVVRMLWWTLLESMEYRSRQRKRSRRSSSSARAVTHASTL